VNKDSGIFTSACGILRRETQRRYAGLLMAMATATTTRKTPKSPREIERKAIS